MEFAHLHPLFKIVVRTLQLLLFADDLTLVMNRDEDAEGNIKVLDKVMTKWRLKINWGRQNAMVVEEEGPAVLQ